MLGDRFWWNTFSFASILLLIVCAARLVYLQGYKHDFYQKLAEAQSEVQISFFKDRGIIYDSMARPLARNQKVASLYTFGRDIENPEQFVANLKAAGVKVSENLLTTLQNKQSFVWISRHMDIPTAKRVCEAVKEVEYTFEDSRFYPEGTMLAGIIGFTGVDNQGLAGIEYYKDSLLKGQATPMSVMRDSSGRYMLFDDSLMRKEADNGLKLTVDMSLQAVTEQILRSDMHEFRAAKAVVLAMDVASGDILVAATAENKKLQAKNYATTYLFEPGSIFKTLSFTYMVEKGLYRADKMVDTSRPYELYGHAIKDVHAYGTLSEQDVFVKSSNIGTVTLMSRAKQADFYDFLISSGFGTKFGIDGVAEEAGLLRPVSKWSGLSLASLSIGQEILVSPMQIVRFYAAIANGGNAVLPRIIKSVIADGREESIPSEHIRIMSEQTSSVMMDLLRSTVDIGTGRRAQSSAVSIGGKTGTAQMIDQSTRAYSKTDYIASFAGVFPAENPQVAMIVMFEAPQSSIYGGSTGAETFRKVAEQMAFYYNLGTEKTKVHYAYR